MKRSRTKKVAAGALTIVAAGGAYALNKRMRVRAFMRRSNKMAHDPYVRDLIHRRKFQKVLEHTKKTRGMIENKLPPPRVRLTKKPGKVTAWWRRNTRKLRRK